MCTSSGLSCLVLTVQLVFLTQSENKTALGDIKLSSDNTSAGNLQCISYPLVKVNLSQAELMVFLSVTLEAFSSPVTPFWSVVSAFFPVSKSWVLSLSLHPSHLVRH